MTKKISEMTSKELDIYKKYRQSDAYKKYQQKYQQSDAYKKSQQKYQQSDAFKKYQQKYQQSDAFKKSRQKYQQSDAYKKSRQKYQQSDAFKKSQQKYRQSDAYKKSRQTSNTISALKEHYLKQKRDCEKALKGYRIPPIPIQGKLIMINEIIDNISIIEKHAEGLDKSIRQRTIDIMLTQLLQKEGILVSKRKQLPIHSPSLKAGVSLGVS